MAVPTLTNGTSTSKEGNPRILAALEERATVFVAARRRPGGSKWLILLMLLVAVGAVISWHYWPQMTDRVAASDEPVSEPASAGTVPVAVLQPPAAHEQTSADAGAEPAVPQEDVEQPAISEDTATATIEEWIASDDALPEAAGGGDPRNPLEQLSVADAGAPQDAGASQNVKPAAPRARSGAAAGSVAKKSQAAPRRSPSDRRKAAQDTAVLASLMAMGLPESGLAGVSISQENGLRIRAVPMDQVAARLKTCDEQGFFQRSVCRADICNDIQGLHPDCPLAEQSDIMP